MGVDVSPERSGKGRRPRGLATMHRLVGRLLVVGAMLAAACMGSDGAGGDRGPAEQSDADPFTDATGPVLAIVPATGITDDGRPVDPTLVFGSDVPSITVVAQAGEVPGSPMDITWFQVTAEDDQELFTHTVEVSSFDGAYSVGENPGALAPGTYRVEATLEGESMSVEFEVTDPEETAAAGQGATSGPPSSGDSGAVSPPDEPVELELFLWPYLDYAPIDPDAATIGLLILSGGGSQRLEAKATMGGNTRTRSFTHEGSDLFRVYLHFDPCAHPGGSDLPGTSAQFEIEKFDRVGEDETLLGSVTFLTRLGPDTARPAVTLNVDPPSGSQVEPGDEIFFDVTAQEARSGLSWQTGVRDLRVKAIPGEDLVPQERAESSTPQPCDRKQWSLATQGSYVVPDDPPPTFRICPIANDFAGNQNADTCATYHTGEVWDGTYTGTFVFEGPGDCRNEFEGTFEIGVDAEGTATMEGTGTSQSFCAGQGVGTFTSDFVAVGERTSSGFRFEDATPYGPGLIPLFTIEVSGDEGTAHYEGPSGAAPGTATIDFEVECRSC